MEKNFLAEGSLRAVWIDTQSRKVFSTSVNSGSGHTILYTWSFDSELPISAQATGLDPVTVFAEGSQRNRLVVGMVDGLTGFINPSLAEKPDRSGLALVQSGRANINAIIMSPDKDRCVTINDRGKAMLQDASTLRIVMLLAEPEMAISSAAYSPNGKVLVTGTKNGDLLIWDATRENSGEASTSQSTNRAANQ